MPRFLVDVNLPYHLSLWRGEGNLHVRDLGERWTDTQIWQYARETELVIVTKDADFSERVMHLGPPPRVVHVRVGNLRFAELHAVLARWWPQVVSSLTDAWLIRIYADRLEIIGG